MLSLLPDYADPARLCGLGKVYEGRLALAELPRLSAMLVDSTGETAFRLAFAIDEKRRAVVRVSVRARLVVQCQRCLESAELPVDSTAELALVRGIDEAERLPPDLDPLMVDGEPLSLRSLVEDELILAIPSAPMHSPDGCPVDLQAVNASTKGRPQELLGDELAGESPFAVLAGLKRQSDNSD